MEKMPCLYLANRFVYILIFNYNNAVNHTSLTMRNYQKTSIFSEKISPANDGLFVVDGLFVHEGLYVYVQLT